MPENGLNENHKRRLAVAMALVDAGVARILDQLDERTSPTTMTVVERSIPQSERTELKETLRELQTLTASVARAYGLDKRRKHLRRTIVAELSQIWTILEDSRPRKMKGMGAVPAEVAESLDRDVDQMLKLLERCRHAVEP
ncbi:MAG: hypothetical protein LAN37_11140 [Acidobacteriia bacterium]|nr:hypothetical protein [Terriglobia bacterium]